MFPLASSESQRFYFHFRGSGSQILLILEAEFGDNPLARNLLSTQQLI